MSNCLKRIGALVVVGASVVAVSACSATSGDGGVVELTYQQFDPTGQVVGLQEAIDEFNDSQDRIHVTMKNVAFADALNTFVREAGAGGGADILHSAFTWTGDLAANGLITDLDDLAAEDAPATPVDGFLGTEINSYEGSLYALPFTADSFALTYNPDRLADAGIESPPQNWDELKADAEQLSGDGMYGLCIPMAGAAGSEVWHATNVYLWSHGSSVVKDDGGWEPGSSDTQLEDAIAYFTSFIDDGLTPQNVLSIPLAGDPVIAEGLAKGDCAMSFQTPQQFSVSLSSNDRLMSAPLPSGPEGQQLQMGGRSLAINANSQHPEEAWEFIRHITGKGVFEDHYTNQFPAQSPLLENKEFGELLTADTFDGYTESLLVARTYVEYLGAPAPIPSIWNALATKANAAYAGQLTPAEAAAQLNEELTTLLKG